jgi:peptidylprolyl isomerase
MRFPTVFALAALLAGAALFGCRPDESTATVDTAPGRPKVTELNVIDAEEGEGPAAEPGDVMALRYRGTLADGREFDAGTISIVLGRGEVIPGWDKGLVGMRVGGRRQLEIPSTMAYGEQAMGIIAPHSDLFFEVELLDMVKRQDMDVVERRELKPGAGREARAGDTVVISYTASTPGGQEFDSSKHHGGQITVTLGKDEIIPTVEAGIVGMRAGGVRRLRLPPPFAQDPVFANLPGSPETRIVYYEIELVEIK